LIGAGKHAILNESMRAGDSDRNQVVELLREALDNGRLTLPEYDQRIATAYRAVTYADLNVLLADLPRTRPDGVLAIPTPHAAAKVTPPAKPKPRRRIPLALQILWTIWGSVTTGGHHEYPWPLWVAVPAGAVLLGVTIGIDWMRSQHDD
jgi:hypothetical protein